MDYKTIIVGIAGGTGSGKTSVTHEIWKKREFTQYFLNKIPITKEMTI